MKITIEENELEMLIESVDTEIRIFGLFKDDYLEEKSEYVYLLEKLNQYKKVIESHK